MPHPQAPAQLCFVKSRIKRERDREKKKNGLAPNYPGPVFPALSPFVRSWMGQGSFSGAARGTAAEMEREAGHPKHEGASDDLGTPLPAESRSSGAWDHVEGMRVRAAKPG